MGIICEARKPMVFRFNTNVHIMPTNIFMTDSGENT